MSKAERPKGQCGRLSAVLLAPRPPAPLVVASPSGEFDHGPAAFFRLFSTLQPVRGLAVQVPHGLRADPGSVDSRTDLDGARDLLEPHRTLAPVARPGASGACRRASWSSGCSGSPTVVCSCMATGTHGRWTTPARPGSQSGGSSPAAMTPRENLPAEKSLSGPTTRVDLIRGGDGLFCRPLWPGSPQSSRLSPCAGSPGNQPAFSRRSRYGFVGACRPPGCGPARTGAGVPRALPGRGRARPCR